MKTCSFSGRHKTAVIMKPAINLTPTKKVLLTTNLSITETGDDELVLNITPDL